MFTLPTRAIPGVAIGLAGAFLGGSLLRALLFDITPADPLSLLGVASMATLVALLAAYAAARRGRQVDPARELAAD